MLWLPCILMYFWRTHQDRNVLIKIMTLQGNSIRQIPIFDHWNNSMRRNRHRSKLLGACSSRNHLEFHQERRRWTIYEVLYSSIMLYMKCVIMKGYFIWLHGYIPMLGLQWVLGLWYFHRDLMTKTPTMASQNGLSWQHTHGPNILVANGLLR